MRRISVVLSMAAIFFFLAYGSTVSAQDKKPIVIGFIHAMSGPMSMYGISSEAGGQIAVDEINAAGGVLGRPLKMITRDDKLNPEVGLREANPFLWFLISWIRPSMSLRLLKSIFSTLTTSSGDSL